MNHRLQVQVTSAVLVAGLLSVIVACDDRSVPAKGVPEKQPAAVGQGSSPTSSTDEPAAKVAVAAVQSEANAGKPLSAEVEDDAAATPATLAEAIKVLDLREFPLLSGAEEPAQQTVAVLSYQSPGTVKAAAEFLVKHLSERGWRRLPSGQESAEYASDSFMRDGFHLSTSVMSPGTPGKILVTMRNHGNVNLRKLPVPSDAKLVYSFPAITSFMTSTPLAETTAAVRILLLDQGWQLYGSAGDVICFKQNAVLLKARVHVPPADPGKTMIDFSSEQMSADIPAPPEASRVQYSDSNRRLDIDVPGMPESLVTWYQQALAPAGWKSTTERAVTDRLTGFMIFRNAAGDMLELKYRDLQQDKATRAALEYRTSAEVLELDRKAKEAFDAKRKKTEAKTPVP